MLSKTSSTDYVNYAESADKTAALFTQDSRFKTQDSKIETLFLYEGGRVISIFSANSRTEGTFHLKESGSLLKTKKGYILILSDSLVQLLQTDTGRIKKSKQAEAIKLYLTSLFPIAAEEGETEEEMAPPKSRQTFRGCGMEDSFAIIDATPPCAALYSDELKAFMKDYPWLFSSAAAITTPSLLAVKASEGDFCLTIGDTNVVKHGSVFLQTRGEVKGYPHSAPGHLSVQMDDRTTIAGWLKEVMAARGLNEVSFKPIQKEAGVFGLLSKRAIISLCVLYLVFASALFMRTELISNDIRAYNNAIAKIYDFVGLSGSHDPYGMLLFRVDRAKGEVAPLTPLKILHAVGSAFDRDVVIEGISTTAEAIKIRGSIPSLQRLEHASDALEKLLEAEFSIEDTTFQEEKVIFVLTGRL